MSFKAAIRAYLFSNSGVANAVSESGALGAGVSGATTEIVVSGLSSAPAARGQLLLKNGAGNYELVNYTAATQDGANYDFTVSVTLQNAYVISDYVAVADGIFSYPASQSASMPYLMVTDVATDEVLNKLNGAATVVFESWQVSCFAETDSTCDALKDAVVAAMNLVNPTTWSDDGFATSYTVDTSVFVSHTTVDEIDDDGSQTPTIHKPVTFNIKRSIASA